MAANFSLQGIVARARSAARALIDGNTSDGNGPRLSRYQEQYSLSPMVGESVLADEGSLFAATMLPGATPLQLGISAVYSATAAALVCKNNAPINGGPNSPRVFIRHIHFSLAVAPAAGTDLQYASILDNINRSPTTVAPVATPATASAYLPPVVCPNMNENPQANGVWWFPVSIAAGVPPTIPAQGGNARVIVGNGLLRAQIPVASAAGASDDYRIVFGANAATSGQLVTAAAAGASRIVESHPAVVIGPQEYFIFYLWSLSNAATGLAFLGLDVSHYER